MKDLLEEVRVPSWPAPKGYANGMIAHGPTLFVAGQIGWNPVDGVLVDGFVAQFAKALDNVIAVLSAANAKPEHIARMTLYVTDMESYRQSLRALGTVWKERLGRHYPAMTAVQVVSLAEPNALLELEVTAVIAEAVARG